MERIRIRAGFTLVELMVVILILGIISTVTFVYIINKPDEAAWKTARVQMEEVRKALNHYRIEHGEYPERLADLTDLDMGKAVNPFTKKEFFYERGPRGDTYVIKFLGKDDAEGEAPIPDEDVIMTERG